MSYVREILDLAQGLSDTYINSKIPLFIKNFLYNYQIKKIRKLIDKLQDDTITFEALFDFTYSVYKNKYNYNHGYAEFRDIRIYSKESSKRNYFMYMKFPINDGKAMVYADIEQQMQGMKLDAESFYSLKIKVSIVRSNKTSNSVYFNNLDKYQELSNEVLADLSRSRYTSLETDIISKVKDILITHVKEYLYESIGIYEGINIGGK